MRQLEPGRLALVALLLGGALGSPASARGQVPDSTRTLVLERLLTLSRPPGLDSALLVPDSTRLLENRARSRPGGARPGEGAGGDSVTAALLALSGFEVTRYEGSAAEFGVATRRLTLQSSEETRARVVRADVEVAADTAIEYDDERGLIRASGGVEFSRAGEEPVNSRTLLYDLKAQRGTALGAKTTYSEGANWRVEGDAVSVTSLEQWMVHTSLTSCELDVPHYHFQTGEIKIVSDNWFVARNVKLYFADVPVAWLPFIAQGMGSGRSSGLLTPTFSVNDIVRTSSGYSRRISNMGFYWAMSDYSDASVRMDWFADRFFSLEGNLGYFVASRFLRGNINYRQFWRAEGGKELSLDTRHDWELDERTRLNVSAKYATSTDFVRENSFDPRELTQSIDSDGGINRRFDWGTLSVGANRKQFLSDDRVELTLPTANLSLSPITLLPAPAAQARFYNNLTWSGGGNYALQSSDRIDQAADSFQLGLADVQNTRAGGSSSFSLGGFSWSQNVGLTRKVTRDVPALVLRPADAPDDLVASDIGQADLTWSTTLDYQQRLIGSLTLTPRVSISGNAIRHDTLPQALDFVAGPRRAQFGAGMKMDLYAFAPGIGPYERLRHKVSPSFSYSYSPEVTPTARQLEVFRGTRVVQTTNELSVTLNHTLEAKVRSTAPAEGQGGDSASVDSAGVSPPSDGGPSRRETAQIVQLLGWNLSAVRYDFVVADSTGRFVDGFQTTRVSNQITSDFFRGLSLSFDTELFDEGVGTGVAGGTEAAERRFDMHLSSLNLGFSVGSSSALFRWLGLTSQNREDATPDEEEEEGTFDEATQSQESSIVPRGEDPLFRGRAEVTPQGARRRSGGWSANLNYSLQRPRNNPESERQMVSGTMRFSPTPAWTVSWRTSYDFEESRFQDHIVRLSRDLHRWEANFDFAQTVTGNWTFRFAVSLRDNQDLKFDYEQRSLQPLR